MTLDARAVHAISHPPRGLATCDVRSRTTRPLAAVGGTIWRILHVPMWMEEDTPCGPADLVSHDQRRTDSSPVSAASRPDLEPRAPCLVPVKREAGFHA